MAKWDEKKLDEFYQRLTTGVWWAHISQTVLKPLVDDLKACQVEGPQEPECKDREVYCDECGQSLGRWCGGELNSHLCARCLSPKPGDERWYWSHRGQVSTFQYFRSDGQWHTEERKEKP